MDSIISRYNPKYSVFINCPFDSDYKKLFDALIFTVVCCGLTPLCARAYVDDSRARLDRLIELMSFAKYSIHDLCRCHGEGSDNYARLNMPLELGISIGLSSAVRSTAGGQYAGPNKWYLLVPNKMNEEAYQRFVSDLKGSDPISHSETQESVITATMNILAVACELPFEHNPKDIIGLPLATYETKLRDYTAMWYGQLPWHNTLRIAMQVAQEYSLITNTSEAAH